MGHGVSNFKGHPPLLRLAARVSQAWGDFYIASHLDNPRFGVKDWDDAKQARAQPWPANRASERREDCRSHNLGGRSAFGWLFRRAFRNNFPYIPLYRQIRCHRIRTILPPVPFLMMSAGEATRVQLWTARFRCHRDCETGALGAMDFIGVMVTYCFMLVRLVLKPVTIKDIKDWLVSHISEFSFLWDFSMTFSFFKGVSFTNRSPSVPKKTPRS